MGSLLLISQHLRSAVTFPLHIKPDGTILLRSFVYPMSNKSASSIVSDTPVASTDAKQPDSSYFTHQRLWYVMMAGTVDG